MSQSKIVITLLTTLLLVALVGGGAFLMKSRLTSNTATGISGNPEQPNTEKKISFTEFVKRGGAYKCEVHQGVGGINTIGTVYLHDGLIRGEYSSEMQGMKMDSMVVVRDGYTYTWSSLLPGRGFKVKVVPAESTPDAASSTSGSYSFNTEQIGDYSCVPWVADDSMFTLPQGTTFIEAK